MQLTKVRKKVCCRPKCQINRRLFNHQILHGRPGPPSLQQHRVSRRQLISVAIYQSSNSGRKCRIRRLWSNSCRTILARITQLYTLIGCTQPTNIPNTMILAACRRLQNAIKYCTKVRPAKGRINLPLFNQILQQHPCWRCLQPRRI